MSRLGTVCLSLLVLLSVLTTLEASQRSGSRNNRRASLGRQLASTLRHHQRQSDAAGRRSSVTPTLGRDLTQAGSAPGSRRLVTLLRKQRKKRRRLSNGKDMCLFKALRRCGRKLIPKISGDSDFEQRCTSREEFLDCMSSMQNGGCVIRQRRRGPSKRLVEQYQRRLRRLLKTTRGCVIGIDLSQVTK